MSDIKTIHLIQRSAVQDFQCEEIASTWYVLLWSESQNCLHIERHKDMLAANRRAYADDRRMDFVPLFVGTNDFCCCMADKLRGTLIRRASLRESCGAVASGAPLLPQVLSALERHAADLSVQAERQSRQAGYGSEAPFSEAELLRAAAQMLRAARQ